MTDELGGKAEGRANAAQLDRVDRQSPHSSQSTSATHAKVTALTTAAGAARAEGPARSYVSAEVLTDMSRKFNQLTGYESIDHLKGRVVEADKQLQQCKQQLRAAKIEYEQQLAKQNQLHRYSGTTMHGHGSRLQLDKHSTEYKCMALQFQQMRANSGPPCISY